MSGDAYEAAIERELEYLREHVAGAPRPVRLGCSTIAHDRLGYCAGCGGLSGMTEANGWRLLALRDAARSTPGGAA